MNTDTGKVYTTETEIEAALNRGEHLAPISAPAARRIVSGRKMLAKKLQSERKAKRSDRRRQIEKAARKKNRS